MAKVKVPRKSTTIDMTAMTDVAFLLLTFFMLATKFKPDEPVIVDAPSSVSEIKLPEQNIMMITVDKDNRVFFTVDGQQYRAALLKRMGEKYNVQFTESEVTQFANMSSFGVPVAQLKALIALSPEERAKTKQAGIPTDSTNNELSEWVWNTRLAYNEMGNNELKVAIKADGGTEIPTIQRVISTLQDRKINRFNLITNMEKAE